MHTTKYQASKPMLFCGSVSTEDAFPLPSAQTSMQESRDSCGNPAAAPTSHWAGGSLETLHTILGFILDSPQQIL